MNLAPSPDLLIGLLGKVPIRKWETRDMIGTADRARPSDDSNERAPADLGESSNGAKHPQYESQSTAARTATGTMAVITDMAGQNMIAKWPDALHEWSGRDMKTRSGSLLLCEGMRNFKRNNSVRGIDQSNHVKLSICLYL